MVRKYSWQKGAGEVLVVASVIFAFLTSACLNKTEMLLQHRIIFTLTFLADLFIIGSWAWLGSSVFIKKEAIVKNIRRNIGSNSGVIITMLYCLFTRVIQFGDRPRWDSLIYYRELIDACQNFDFTMTSFLNGFSLVNHPTLGYAGIAAIGEFWDSGGYNGVLVIQLLLNVLMSYCLYRIVEKLLPLCSRLYHTLGTCVVLSTPLTLGTFSYFQPDAGTVYFIVFSIYCYMKKKNILMFFSMILLVLSKEVGIIALAGFGAGALLGYVTFEGRERSFWKRTIRFFRKPLGIAMGVAMAGFLIYVSLFLKNGGSIWKIADDKIAGFSTFSLQPAFVIYKWKQFFTLNFNWLIWGTVLFFIVYLLIHGWNGRGFTKGIGRLDIVSSVLTIAMSLIFFYCMYVTYAIARYHVLVDFCGVLLFVVLGGGFFRSTTLRDVLTFLTGILLLIEAYITIDPITLLLFENKDTGKGAILTDMLEGNTGGEFTVTNHKFNYLGKITDAILDAVDYHEGMDILIWDKASEYAIWESGIWWDMEIEKRVFVTNENTIMLRGIEREDLEKGNILLSSEAVFITFPQFGVDNEFAVNFLEKHYEIRYRGEVEIPFGGKAAFYVCDRVG